MELLASIRQRFANVQSLFTFEEVSTPNDPPALLRYGLALIVVLLATVLTAVLRDIVESFRPNFLFFMVAVFLAAWYGGRKAGFFAIVLSVIILNILFLSPSNTISITNEAFFLLAVFAGLGMMISWFEGQRQQSHTERQARIHAERSANRIEQLYQVGVALSGALTAEQIAEVVVKQGVIALGANAGSVVMLNEDKTMFDVLKMVGYSEEIQKVWQRFAVDDAAAPFATVARTRQPVWLKNRAEFLAQYKVKGEQVANTNTAWAAVPLLVHDELIGAIGLSFSVPQAFDDEDRNLIMALSNQCAQALEQARLYEAEQAARTQAEQSAHRIERLYRVTQALARAVGVPQVAQVIIDQSLEVLNASTGTFQMLVENGTAFEMVYLAGGRNPAEQSHWQRYPADPALPITQVARSKQPLWVETMQDWITNYPMLASIASHYQGAGALLPLINAGEVVGVIGLIFPDERKFSPEDKDFMLALTYQCVQALERARLYETERQARELLQVRVGFQSVIADLGQQALLSSDMSTLMNITVTLLAQTLDVEYTKILEHHPDDHCLLLKAGVGWEASLIGHATVGDDLESQAGYTLASSYPVMVEDLRAETRFTGPPLLHEYHVISGMSVIIQGHIRAWGVLGVHSTRQRRFTHDDIYFLQSVANILGAALERARLQERSRQAAIVEERHRLARDLHDSVTQTLFSASSMTEGLLRIYERQPQRVPVLLTDIHHLVRGAGAELRFLLYELRPELIERSTLTELVSRLCDAVQARKQTNISFQTEGNSTISDDIKMAVFRIAQESLTNMTRHAHATECRILLRCQPDGVELRIHDNGQGFDPDQLFSGLGLVGMRERAAAINANLQIVSSGGNGTEIMLTWKSPSA